MFAPFALLLAAGACSVPSIVRVSRDDHFALRASEPLRIAVLPLRDAVPAPSLFFYLGRPFVWAARAVTLDFRGSMPTTESAADTMRSLLSARLVGESTEIVDHVQLDCALRSRTCDGTAASFATLAQELDVDAVIEGELHGLGAGWAVVRTNRELAGVVRLRDGMTGAVLFSADVAIGNGAGIDHGPTGWVSLVATPLAALDSGPYTEMAIDWAEVVGRELLGTSVLAGANGEPVVANVVVTAPERRLGAGDDIEVAADGSPGASVHFHLGSLHRQIPMFAAETLDDGRVRYRGVYRVRVGDRAAEAPIAVHLLWPGGGEAAQSASRLVDVFALPSPPR
ncbi:MAG: hypothetical protein JNK78_13055 [Planctomycetes bacterium]|nr:hypothetical protein [Planctomycetota bacterium]